MYLIDTNVWLERLLDREKSAEAAKFFEQIPGDLLFMTDFSLHSMGVIFSKLKQAETLESFIDDVFNYSAARLIHLTPQDLIQVSKTISKFGLDFDDAYQYVAAEKYDLTIISFDSDFDNTKRKRKMPGEILSELD